jgi:Mn2+/Fe2+ NRAMP family transporter
MVSAAGSGELLFTPRIGAQYGYALLWALLAAVALKWGINREIGRMTVVTGAPVLTVAAGRGWKWALWLLLAPQLVVAVATIAGLAGAAATALVLALPGDIRVWTVASVLASSALVFAGRYRVIERTAILLAGALGIAAVAAALSVGPDPGALARGLLPRVPAAADPQEVLPWLGFLLSGAAGMLWYSYWLAARGYGAAATATEGGTGDVESLSGEARARLRGWLRLMTLDNTVAVAGTLIITTAFLVLGTELLRPRGLVPDEGRVAEVLGRLLGDVWGRAGFWFMVLGVFVGFWDTVLSDQDGFARMYAAGLPQLLGRRLPAGLADERRLKRVFVVVVLTALPIAIYLAAGEPVGLLKVAGAVEAAHIPVVAVIVLVLNRRALPRDLQPRWPSMALVALAAVFFTAFAGYYVASLAGLVGGQP